MIDESTGKAGAKLELDILGHEGHAWKVVENSNQNKATDCKCEGCVHLMRQKLWLRHLNAYDSIEAEEKADNHHHLIKGRRTHKHGIKIKAGKIPKTHSYVGLDDEGQLKMWSACLGNTMDYPMSNQIRITGYNSSLHQTDCHPATRHQVGFVFQDAATEFHS